MSKSQAKTFADLIPFSKAPTFSDLSPNRGQEFNTSSLMRITEPINQSAQNGSGKQTYSLPIGSTQSLNVSRRNQASNSKRLKLKDYLHLNSIEKKSKKSNSSSKIQFEQSLELSKKASIAQSATQTPKSPYLYSTSATESRISRPSVDSNEILKQDIAKRIEKQIQELNDLANYVKKDFKVHENEAESHCLLFNALNAVLDASKNYEAIGEQIARYEKKQEDNGRGSREYFWEDRYKDLQSPAKILEKGLELTFNLTKMLGIKK